MGLEVQLRTDVRAIFGTIFLLGFSASGLQAQTPLPPPVELLAMVGKPGWMVDRHSACWIWNSNPERDETVSWSGSCDPGGKAQGKGTLEWKIAEKVTTRYVGELQVGKMNGIGSIELARGDRFEGEFRDGKLQGKATGYYSNKDIYVGEFASGQREGKGVYSYANGDRYEGGFVNGKLEGQGVYLSAKANRYEGVFRNGRPHGLGKAVFDGRTYEGTWVDGCFRDGSKKTAMFRNIRECP